MPRDRAKRSDRAVSTRPRSILAESPIDPLSARTRTGLHWRRSSSSPHCSPPPFSALFKGSIGIATARRTRSAPSELPPHSSARIRHRCRHCQPRVEVSISPLRPPFTLPFPPLASQGCTIPASPLLGFNQRRNTSPYPCRRQAPSAPSPAPSPSSTTAIGSPPWPSC